MNAFSNYSTVTEIFFLPAADGEKEAESLSIRENAFTGTSLTEVTLPQRLTDAASSSLGNISSLQNVKMAEEGAYTSIEGLLCKNTDDGAELVFFPKGRRVTLFEVPAEIVSIGEGAFRLNSRIQRVVIPGHVTNIAKSAFENCAYLETIEFKGTAQDPDLTIGESAFAGLDDLTSVTLPENLVNLASYAFRGANKLTSVTVNAARESVNYGANAVINYAGNAVVKELYLGAGVPAFGITDVFGSNLQAVHVDPQNLNYWSDDDGVLYNHDKDILIFFPVNWEGEFEIRPEITEIASGIFAGRDLDP